MSATIEDIECPNCGEFARREQDNKSGDVYIYCTECQYTSDNAHVTNDGEEQD